jgi:BASS family bile acid:Na+ symporter
MIADAIDMPTVLALTPKVIAAIAIVATMVQLGLELQPIDRAAKRRERRLVVLALVVNFVFVPLLAFVVVRGLGARGPVGIALLLLAAAPGGRHAPMVVRAAGADVGLAVEITLFVNKLNALLSPLLAAAMLGVEKIDLRELVWVLELLLLQILPWFTARLLRKWRPSLATKLVAPARWTALAATLALLVYVVAHHGLRVTLVLGWRGWVSVLVFGLVLLALGWLVGGSEPATRRSFALSTEARNLALALVIASIAVRDQTVLLSIFGAWLLLLALSWLAVVVMRIQPLPRRAVTYS